jgi:hypothetical protein
LSGITAKFGKDTGRDVELYREKYAPHLAGTNGTLSSLPFSKMSIKGCLILLLINMAVLRLIIPADAINGVNFIPFT